MSYTIASLPTAGTLYQATSDGTRGSPITSVPAADANGAADASFTFTVSDGRSDSPAAMATIAITPVNDAPSFSPGANQTVAVTAGAQAVVGWASSFTPGRRSRPDGAGLHDRRQHRSGAVRGRASGRGERHANVHAAGGRQRQANRGQDTSLVKTLTITVTPNYQIALPLIVR